jgi:hypothetical protein
MLLGLSLAEPLWSSPPVLSERDIAEAIKYGRKWGNGNNFLVDGLDRYRSRLIDNGYVRITVTCLTDWARIALGSAWQKMAGKESDPASWISVAKAGRLVTMVLIVSPGGGRGALSEGFYGSGKAYSVIKIDGNTITPTREENHHVEADRFSEAWVPTTKQLADMIRDTKGSVTDFTRLLPKVEARNSFDSSQYQLVFLLNSFAPDRDLWAGKAEFLLFDGDGRKMSAQLNLSKLR